MHEKKPSIPTIREIIYKCFKNGKYSFLNLEVYGLQELAGINESIKYKINIQIALTILISGPKQFFILHFIILTDASVLCFSTYPVLCVIAPYKSKQVGSLYISISFKTISGIYYNFENLQYVLFEITHCHAAHTSFWCSYCNECKPKYIVVVFACCWQTILTKSCLENSMIAFLVSN